MRVGSFGEQGRHWLRHTGRSLAAGASLLVLGTLAAIAQPVQTDHVTAELVAERSAVQPGQPLRIGLKLQHIPHWHTYWRNPGDSGLPTTLSWTLPPGSQAGEIEWPAPKRLPIGPLVNYGYEGALLLPVVYTPPADAKPGSMLTLKAQATWLVCKDVCIPETATLRLQLPVVGGAGAADGISPGSTAHSAAFDRAAGEQAEPLAGWRVDAQQAGRELLVSLAHPASTPAAGRPPVHLFPYAEQLIEPALHEVFRTDAGYAIKLRLLDGVAPPTSLKGLLVAQGDLPPGTAAVWGGTRQSAEFDTAVRSVTALAMPVGAQVLRDDAVRTAAPARLGGGADLGWVAALLLAFVGGMVLNLMPCVFPVLSIKLLSLARQGDAQPVGALRRHALAYTAGVVLSFLALAGGLLALRAAGSAVGWGFQLQEPGVVFVLALLFFTLGLNLMGAFEFGGLLPSGLAAWRAERPAVDALASGVLAVVAASPCTAPFMGAALGYAITQSPAVGLSVFAALGLGMALPYALLVLMPGWRSRLPKPGAWMLRLKQALAFPMFLTVVWLVWVLGQQTGVDGAAKALIALVALAFGVWIASGRSAGEGSTRAPLARRAIGGVLLAGALAWSWPGAAVSEGGTARSAAISPAASAVEAAWQPYDEAIIAQRLAAGQAVFVDFTAAWCVSCQVNKRLVLHTDDTMQAFGRAQVALMRADWTQRDARITEALARMGRNGVPVYVLMRPGREPLLLPEILTARLVRDALATL